MASAVQPYVIPQLPVESSNIASRGYDLERHVLAITFKSGDVWHYGSVPVDLAERFFEASSPGRFYTEQIKGKFAGQKMTGPCKACGAKGPIGTTCEDCGCGPHVEAPRREARA